MNIGIIDKEILDTILIKDLKWNNNSLFGKYGGGYEFRISLQQLRLSLTNQNTENVQDCLKLNNNNQ